MKSQESESTPNQNALHFQDRDELLLKALQEYDGVLARRHIKYLFWKNKSWRAMEKRLSKLHLAQYIEWASVQQRKIYPVPEPVIWLGWKGALYLAGRLGMEVHLPVKSNEYHLRQLEKSLRESGFSWLREPRWSQLKHDLTVVDVRFWVRESLSEIPALIFDEWKNESSFKSDPDRIDFQVKSREGEIIHKRKGVCPDGFFTISDPKRQQQGESFQARFLIEIDMATHDTPSFGIEKAAAGVAYIKSKQYQNRFGSNKGNWLIITTGEIRMRNLIHQTKERVSEDERNLFFFTTFNQIKDNNFFSSPIWRKLDQGELVSLLE
jgi:hypothetical protein